MQFRPLTFDEVAGLEVKHAIKFADNTFYFIAQELLEDVAKQKGTYFTRWLETAIKRVMKANKITGMHHYVYYGESQGFGFGRPKRYDVVSFVVINAIILKYGPKGALGAVSQALGGKVMTARPNSVAIPEIETEHKGERRIIVARYVFAEYLIAMAEGATHVEAARRAQEWGDTIDGQPMPLEIAMDLVGHVTRLGTAPFLNKTPQSDDPEADKLAKLHSSKALYSAHQLPEYEQHSQRAEIKQLHQIERAETENERTARKAAEWASSPESMYADLPEPLRSQFIDEAKRKIAEGRPWH